MKGIALGIAALGILLASAAPSLADHWHGYYHGPYHYHGGHYYYGGYGPVVVSPSPVVVSPAPAYGYSGYAPYPAVAPVYAPAVAPVYPPAVAPYYYGPSVGLGFRARGLSVGVGL